MAAKNTKPAELTDIPLTLEQGDSVGMNATKPDKMKSNSLKRFFRTAKGGSSGSMPSSKNPGSNDSTNSPNMRTDGSFQMRFGSFRKSDVPADLKMANDELEAGSSVDRRASKLQSNTDSRMSLQDRLSSFWNNVFKKSSKKSLDAKDDPVQDTTIVPSNEVNQIEPNPSDNL